MNDEHAADAVEQDAATDEAPALPDHPVLAELAAAFPPVRFERIEPNVGIPQDVAHVPAAALTDFAAAVHDAGYTTFLDLCGVDYLRRRPRFEVVITVLDADAPHRLRLRVPVDGAEPVVDSITPTYPGANFYERETYDLLGLEFAGHPDLTRILLPDEWEGHPLRKDHAVGSVPVQFKESPKVS